MKNSIFTILAFFMLPLFMQAQSNNPYDYVGLAHNQTLNAIFPIVAELEDPNSVDIHSMIENYLNTIGGEFEGTDFTNALNQDFLNEMALVYNQGNNAYIQMKLDEGVISPELFNALSEMFAIIDSPGSINAMIQRLKDLLNPPPTFPPNPFEELIYYSALSTAIRSAEYWQEAVHEYSNECCDADYLEQMLNNDTRDIVAVDAGCAVGGAMAGAAAGGVGAGPGALIGGAAGSVAKGVEVVVTRVWNWLFR